MSAATTMGRSGRHRAVGVDVGGTFTDLVLYDAQRRELRTAKLLTTPHDPSEGVLNGIAELLGPTERLDSVDLIVHGTTLAANTLIERKGAKTALITTDGFRDILETGSERRYDLYDVHIEYPAPLVPRALRFGLRERLRFDGSVALPLDTSGLRHIADRLTTAGIKSVGVCLMHSYLDPSHERQVLAHLRKWAPEVLCTLSSDVLPEIGDHARMSTTVANAYVQPLMRGYLEALVRGLRDRGYRRTLYVTASSGGTLTAKVAGDFPIRLLESGPAAGAFAVSLLSKRVARRNLIAFDMGGTTAKACVIKDTVLERTTELEAARLSRFKRGSGLLVRAPSVDIFEIGAGGGSIASVDSLGLLRVGPESAGAVPGPVCYGRGGTLPTVTDANLVLGYLDPESFLGGTIKLDVRAAAEAIEKHIAGPLGCGLVEAAQGIFAVVNQNMADAIAMYGAEKGLDLRDFALVAFGGAGPVHAWEVARRLRFREIIVPPTAGLLSALGCIAAPLSFEFARSYKGEIGALDWRRVRQVYGEMEAMTRRLLREAGATKVRILRSCDMRHRGQRSEVSVPLHGLPLVPREVPKIIARFKSVYLRRYGRDIPGVIPEVVTWRVAGVAADVVPTLPAASALPRRRRSRGTPPPRSRSAFFPAVRKFLPVSVYDRGQLAPGFVFSGPAVVVERETTTVVPARARGRVSAQGDLIIELRHE